MVPVLAVSCMAPSMSTGLAAGCAPSGLLCSKCTSPSKTVAPTGPSTGLPTALGRPPPGSAPPAALAGREPAGSPGSVEQQCASHHARMEGAMSSQAAVTTLQDGRVTPARQTWMNVVLEGALVPRTV
ncbi:hypothetical protein VULLAG_LOCUS22600 [Vulpes lagopus]